MLNTCFFLNINVLLFSLQINHSKSTFLSETIRLKILSVLSINDSQIKINQNSKQPTVGYLILNVELKLNSDTEAELIF